MDLKGYWGLLKEAGREWLEDKAPRLGASLAYYTALSIAPLLVIAIFIAGMVFGKEAAQGYLLGQMRDLVGVQGGRGRLACGLARVGLLLRADRLLRRRIHQGLCQPVRLPDRPLQGRRPVDRGGPRRAGDAPDGRHRGEVRSDKPIVKPLGAHSHLPRARP